MVVSESMYTTRHYVAGDEFRFVELFNDEHCNLVGFVPRTVKYWRWCCLNRPDVDENGILIVEVKGTIVGYVVVGKSGNVWELCYNSMYDRKAIVLKLLTWTLDYSKSVNSDSVVLNAYIYDEVVREVCNKLDFAQSPSEPMFLSVLDLPELICEIIRAKKTCLDADELFWFNLRKCPSWCVSSFGIKIGKNKVSSFNEDIDNNFPKTIIETEMSTLVAIIFGTESALKAIMSSKVQFDSFWKISRALKFFNLLRANSPWFTPRADIG